MSEAVEEKTTLEKILEDLEASRVATFVCDNCSKLFALAPIEAQMAKRLNGALQGTCDTVIARPIFGSGLKYERCGGRLIEVTLPGKPQTAPALGAEALAELLAVASVDGDPDQPVLFLWRADPNTITEYSYQIFSDVTRKLFPHSQVLIADEGFDFEVIGGAKLRSLGWVNTAAPIVPEVPAEFEHFPTCAALAEEQLDCDSRCADRIRVKYLGWDELMTAAAKDDANVTYGRSSKHVGGKVPWCFSFLGFPVTHIDDDRYVLTTPWEQVVICRMPSDAPEVPNAVPQEAAL